MSASNGPQNGYGDLLENLRSLADCKNIEHEIRTRLQRDYSEKLSHLSGEELERLVNVLCWDIKYAPLVAMIEDRVAQRQRKAVFDPTSVRWWLDKLATAAATAAAVYGVKAVADRASQRRAFAGPGLQLNDPWSTGMYQNGAFSDPSIVSRPQGRLKAFESH